MSSPQLLWFAQGAEPLPGSTPDSFAVYVGTEIDRWAAIIKASDVAELE
jgi:hypothetical protein